MITMSSNLLTTNIRIKPKFLQLNVVQHEKDVWPLQCWTILSRISLRAEAKQAKQDRQDQSSIAC